MKIANTLIFLCLAVNGIWANKETVNESDLESTIVVGLDNTLAGNNLDTNASKKEEEETKRDVTCDIGSCSKEGHHADSKEEEIEWIGKEREETKRGVTYDNNSSSKEGYDEDSKEEESEWIRKQGDETKRDVTCDTDSCSKEGHRDDKKEGESQWISKENQKRVESTFCEINKGMGDIRNILNQVYTNQVVPMRSTIAKEIGNMSAFISAYVIKQIPTERIKEEIGNISESLTPYVSKLFPIGESMVREFWIFWEDTKVSGRNYFENTRIWFKDAMK